MFYTNNCITQMNCEDLLACTVCLCVCALTYYLDDFCQQNSIGYVLSQVFNKPRTTGLGQIMVRPISVDLYGIRIVFVN